MISGVSGAGAQRELAKFEPRVNLSMGRRIIEILQENMISGVSGAGAQRELAKFEPRVDLSMGRKISGIP